MNINFNIWKKVELEIKGSLLCKDSLISVKTILPHEIKNLYLRIKWQTFLCDFMKNFYKM